MADSEKQGRSEEGLETPVQFVKGVGPAKAELYAKLGVATAGDLLFLLPRGYEDLQSAKAVAYLREGPIQAVQVRCEHVAQRTTKTGKTLVTGLFRDQTGYLEAVWFNWTAVVDRLKLDATFELTGKAERQLGARWKMTNPKVRVLNPNDRPAPGASGSPGESGPSGAAAEPAVLQPIYPLTEGLHPDSVRRAVQGAVDRYADLLPERLPDDFRQSRRLMALAEAVRTLHAPLSTAQATKARERLAFEELLVLQLALAVRRAARRGLVAHPIEVSPTIDQRIRRRFPFPLTPGQDQAVADVVADLAKPRPMYRMLQGDVGSGKTAVAVYAMLAAVAARLQAVFLAPTEVLAQQQFQWLDELLQDSKVRRVLITGSLPAAQRQAINIALADGAIDLVVGTHAVLNQAESFARLGLVVFDEQHKFGVRQRAAFQSLPVIPHYLVMTATPIPRSLGMTWFGDLDLTMIRDKPAGRQQTLTYVVPALERAKAYEFLAKRARAGQQGIVVCSRINTDADDAGLFADEEEAESWRPPRGLAADGSGALPRSVMDVHEEMLQGAFADIPLALVHGRMDEPAKSEAIRRFRRGEARVLISTVVIEVGLDVPNANILLIENAERFGLAQLHQIRGRVGRGSERGICFLLNAGRDQDVQRRLEDLAATTDGFRIAELDAQTRGIGEFLGGRQSGHLRLQVADVFRDGPLIEQARLDARTIIDADPTLSAPRWAHLRAEVIRRYAATMELALVG